MGLSLMRRVGERLKIDDDTIVTVLAIKGSYVKIGINAPKHIRIRREDSKKADKKGNTDQ